MDQPQLIDEIMHSHNIMLNKAHTASLQSAIQQRLDLSSKIRNFPGN